MVKVVSYGLTADKLHDNSQVVLRQEGLSKHGRLGYACMVGRILVHSIYLLELDNVRVDQSPMVDDLSLDVFGNLRRPR